MGSKKHDDYEWAAIMSLPDRLRLIVADINEILEGSGISQLEKLIFIAPFVIFITLFIGANTKIEQIEHVLHRQKLYN